MDGPMPLRQYSTVTARAPRTAHSPRTPDAACPSHAHRRLHTHHLLHLPRVLSTPRASRPPRELRGLVSVLGLLLLAVLSGCFTASVELDIQSETQAALSVELIDTSGQLGLTEDTCADFFEDALANQAQFFTDADSHPGCSLSTVINPDDAGLFTVEHMDDELVFTGTFFDFDDEAQIDFGDPGAAMFSPEVSLTITFPGKATYASAGGKIKRASVTWDEPQYLVTPVEARGKLTGGVFIPGWGFVAFGLVALAALAYFVRGYLPITRRSLSHASDSDKDTTRLQASTPWWLQDTPPAPQPHAHPYPPVRSPGGDPRGVDTPDPNAPG